MLVGFKEILSQAEKGGVLKKNGMKVVVVLIDFRPDRPRPNICTKAKRAG